MKTILFSIILCLFSTQAFAQALTVAVAKGYKRPFSEIIRLFEKEKAIEVEAVFGNMRQIISQAELSGKVSVIIGDKKFLEESSLSLSLLQPVGEGRLVLAYPKGIHIQDGMETALLSMKKVAMPQPKKAIYGRAAEEYLLRSGLYEKLKDRLLIVATVPQVSSYLIAGEIDGGFINITDALGIRDQIGGYIEVDRRLYAPIELAAAALKVDENAREVQEFLSFLRSEKVKEILKGYGL